MAGRPKLRALISAIAKTALEANETPEDYFFGRLINGETLNDIADTFQVSRTLLYEWIHQTPERHAKLPEARKLAAHSFAEDALQRVDHANPDTASLAREQARVRQWLAASYDRDTYAPNASHGTTVNINLGQAHLEALRSLARESLPNVIATPALMPGDTEDPPAHVSDDSTEPDAIEPAD